MAAGLFGFAIRGYAQRRGPDSLPAIDQEAETAYKAFDSEGNPDKKIQLGEEFEQKFLTGRYQEEVASVLIILYYNKDDWEKFFATAHTVIAEDPDDIPILELVGWVIPRQYKATDPGESAKLDESEKYEKHALQLIAAMKKPKVVTKDQFDNAQSSLEWRAHSGLGITYFRRRDFEHSAEELQIAVTQEYPDEDPTDLFILGLDLQQLKRMREAADEFTKCSEIPGDLQDRCIRSANAAATAAVQQPGDLPSTPGTAAHRAATNGVEPHLPLPPP